MVRGFRGRPVSGTLLEESSWLLRSTLAAPSGVQKHLPASVAMDPYGVQVILAVRLLAVLYDGGIRVVGN